MSNNYVLAMYDVRGIQDYIFRTSKIRDAIGASALVENIIEDALADSCNKIGLSEEQTELRWFDSNGSLQFNEPDKMVQVLYVGGGNAYVLFNDRRLAVNISKKMAKYTMDKTYSLQLASAIVDKTDEYSFDYQQLNAEMIKIKDHMIVSKPLDAIPVMEVERKTGFPVTCVRKYKDSMVRMSTESALKMNAGVKKRKLDGTSNDDRILDSYITKKGKDSMIAVVHIDGNNMGNRIRRIVENKKTYVDAVNAIREISYNINTLYKKVFEDMSSFFNSEINDVPDLLDKEKKNSFIMKVLVAGDDITYVCNAKIAISTVEYFVKHISGLGMLKDDPQNEYRFSVCGGIAYINSHFPFNIGYEVAEACCDSAKEKAKLEENMNGDTVGNWVDFQVCKNIHARDVKRIRKREYITRNGEKLYKRPYFIIADDQKNVPVFKKISEGKYSIQSFKSEMAFVTGNKTAKSDDKPMIRSFAKKLRNLYPLGESSVNQFVSFIKSRINNIPDNMYYEESDGKKVAIYYDALELMDDYVDIPFGEKEAQS